MVRPIVDKYGEWIKCSLESQTPTYMLSLCTSEVLIFSDVASIPLLSSLMPNIRHIAISFYICDRSILSFMRSWSFPHLYSWRWSLSSVTIQTLDISPVLQRSKSRCRLLKYLCKTHREIYFEHSKPVQTLLLLLLLSPSSSPLHICGKYKRIALWRHVNGLKSVKTVQGIHGCSTTLLYLPKGRSWG